MTKEEKIKEAWGEYWERLSDVQKLLALDNNGYTSIGYSEYQSKLHVDLKKSKLFDVDANTRPKLLQGIETNNGWIKIISEKDLPKEKCDLLVYPEFENQFVFHFYNDKKCKEVLMQNHTHYQQIEKPKPPIY